MAFLPTNASQVQQFAGALYGISIGSSTLAQVNADIAALGSLNGALNAYYKVSFGATATSVVANTIVTNLGITGDAATAAKAYVQGRLDATAADSRGAVVSEMLNQFLALTGDATFGAAATAWATKVEAAVNYTGAANVPVGTIVTTSQTFVLKAELDTVVVSGDGPNTVKGIFFNDATKDTYSFGDDVQGNGKTVLDLVAAAAGTLPYVTMSGVDSLKVLAAAAGTVIADASTYGTAVNAVSLAGVDGAVLDVNKLTVTGTLAASVAGASDSDLQIAGSIDGLKFSATLENDDLDSVAATASVSKAAIALAGGENDYNYLYLYQTKADDAASVSVGDVAIGTISINNGKSATATVTISNGASNSNSSGAATAGNITVGNITAVSADSGDGVLFFVYNSATADSGAATVGNVAIGDVNFAIGDSAAGMTSFTVYNSAEVSTKGAATAGNISLGNVTVTGGDVVDYLGYMYFYNYADTPNGAAKVGNITVGDIDVSGGDTVSAYYYFSNQADAGGKAAATAGNITAGDVTYVAGDSGFASFDFLNYAYAVTGAATAGTVTVGDVSLTVGNSNSASFTITNSATAASGAATVGAVTVGEISAVAGLNGGVYFYIDQYANGKGAVADSVGAVTVGNVDMYGEPNAYLTLSMDIYSDNGSVGNVTVGNVDMTVDGTGDVAFSLEVTAAKNVGDISVGDVTLTLGSSASIDTYSIDVTSTTGNVGNVTLGALTIVGGVGAYDDDAGVSVVADDDIGAVSIGDVTVTAAKNADFDSLSYDFTATNGSIDSITVGDIGATAAQGASADLDMDFFAEDGIGDIAFGDVNLSAAKDASAYLTVDVTASDDIGAVTLGDVTLSASGGSAAKTGYAYAGNFLDVNAGGNSIGAVTIGNIDISAVGGKIGNVAASAGAYFDDTGDTVGLVTVGNITLSATNVAAATFSNDVFAGYYVDSNGAVKVGDIAVTAGDVTASFADDATVSFSVDLDSGSTLTVGNITVVGGQANTNDVVLDNLGTLSNWLTLAGTTSVTVGNVDYSGYEAGATINVSSYKGAAVIKAAQDDTTITDNKTKNEIYLGAGTDQVIMSEAMTTTKTDATTLDVIYNFKSGTDTIAINTTSGTADFAFVSSVEATYTAFLASAGAAMSVNGKDVYAGRVGSDVYVAFDKDGQGAVDFVIKLAGISSVQAADFIIT